MTIRLFQIMYFAIGLFFPTVRVSGHIALAQAYHESGKFKSRRAVEDKNLFGMTYPKLRKTAAAGKDEDGFCVFRSYWDSIKDFYMFLQALGLDTDSKLVAYYPVYATDPNYTRKLAAVKASLEPHLINPAHLVAGGAALAVGGVLAANALSNEV